MSETYYIGIEDLTANAMILALENIENNEEATISKEQQPFSFEKLEEYGKAVMAQINQNPDRRALMVLSRASTEFMFRNFPEYFAPTEDAEPGVRLRKNVTAEDLKEKFWSYKAPRLLDAFRCDNAKEVLFRKEDSDIIQEKDLPKGLAEAYRMIRELPDLSPKSMQKQKSEGKAFLI